MNKKKIVWNSLLVVQALLLLVVIALLVAILTGNAVGRPASSAPAEYKDAVWLVPDGWLRERLWPAAVEPAEPEFPHFLCPDPRQC